MGGGSMGGPTFISVNRCGSNSSILQSRSIREGRAELRAASDCSDWPKTGTSTPHDQTRRGLLSRSWRQGMVHCPDLGDKVWSIVQILATMYGPLSKSWPETAASTPHDQTRRGLLSTSWSPGMVHCPDPGDYVA